jgi:hypothetical protein
MNIAAKAVLLSMICVNIVFSEIAFSETKNPIATDRIETLQNNQYKESNAVTDLMITDQKSKVFTVKNIPASIREFETMLMVSALKCRNSHPTIMDDYNGFIRARRAELSDAASQLRAHFASTDAGINGYDKHMTSIANRYGGWNMGPDCSTALSLIHSASSGQNLILLAQNMDQPQNSPPPDTALPISDTVE